MNWTLSHLDKKGVVMFKIMVILLLFVSFVFSQDTLKVYEYDGEISVVGHLRIKDNPITEKTYSQDDLQQIPLDDKDVPAMLTYTPAIQFYSDMGTFYGYSYFRLRGIDQTRINATLDGVPLNEPEDMGVYFNNYPDFLSSVQDVQIQRGVGTTSNGTASYGGSLNFTSKTLDEEYSRLNFNYGSYNTYKFMAEQSFGINEDGIGLNLRFSRVNTKGYRDNSGHYGYSFYLSGGVFKENYAFKYITFYGNQENEMAYLATHENDLSYNRQMNYLSPNEKDHFHYWFNSLSYMSEHVTNTIYFIKLDGTYGVLAEDMLNFNLDSYYLGNILNVNYDFTRLKLYSGFHLYTYKRNHSMDIIGDEVYKNYGIKNEASGFIKGSYDITRDIDLFGDVQVRYNEFIYNGSVSPPKTSWLFVNPKVGVKYGMYYVSIGQNMREPTRNDLFNGEDDLNEDNIHEAYQVEPEKVLDIEAGIKYIEKDFTLNVNLYHMDFTNEIAAIGELSYIGLPLRMNVPKSTRQGIEIESTYKFSKDLSMFNFIGVNKSNIKEYGVYKDVTPLLSPELTYTGNLIYNVNHYFTSGVYCRYMGESFLDNENTTKMKPYFVTDLYFKTTFKELIFSFTINNVFDNDYYNSGYVYDGANYYVAALRNYTLGVTINL